jgi:arsenate reductase-like glutaredoxin family protein
MSYENLIVHDSSITKPTEEEVNAKIQELKDAEQAAINKKTSGKQKLKDLGLDDAEIKALMGA